MTRSFRSLPGTSGPFVVIEDTADQPIRLMVVTSYVDVPADWRGPSLERHLGEMQERAIAQLAKQGWEYDGGPFVYENPFTHARRYIPGGFAIQRTGVVTHATDEGEVGHIEYANQKVPITNGVLRYLLAARYRKRTWKTELLLPEDDARGGFIR